MTLTAAFDVKQAYRMAFVASIFLLPSFACAQSTVTAGSVNGVLNPTQFSGSDIGAQINTAWKSGRTVRIPAGTYSFSTTIVHPGDPFRLECDSGTVLNYTGSGDAIILSNNNANGDQNAGIDGNGGCILQGTSAAQSGIHVYPSNHDYIRNIRIFGFTNQNSGYGIYDTGGNSLTIDNVDLHANNVGLKLTGIHIYGNDYAANAVHISHSEISTNVTWGIVSDQGACSCTQNLGNVYSDNVLEANGTGDMYINWDWGASITGNYFESGGVGVDIGATQNVWSTTVERNYFTVGNPESIEIGYGIGYNILYNSILRGSTSNCFINITTGPNGGYGGVRGVGTNFTPNTKAEFCKQGTPTTTP